MITLHCIIAVSLIVHIIVSASILSFQYDQSLSVIAPLKIELSCMGKGRPVPSVTWYKGENEITSNNDDDTGESAIIVNKKSDAL